MSPNYLRMINCMMDKLEEMLLFLGGLAMKFMATL